MGQCQSCGANLAADSIRCAYCGANTPQGLRLEQERAQVAWSARAAADASRLAEARASIARTGTFALLWSALGLACCLPASLIGLAMWLRARRMATRHGVVVPLSATLGLVLGLIGVGFTGLGFAAYRSEVARVEDRLRELDRTIEATATAPELDEATACALVETRLLRSGYEETSAASIHDIACEGLVEQVGARARLRGVAFDRSGAKRATAVACFARGTRWVLTALAEDPPCSGFPRERAIEPAPAPQK